MENAKRGFNTPCHHLRQWWHTYGIIYLEAIFVWLMSLFNSQRVIWSSEHLTENLVRELEADHNGCKRLGPRRN